MLKLTHALAVCTALALGGSTDQKPQTAPGQKPQLTPKSVSPPTGKDSPIEVSDGSSHIKPTDHDFQRQNHPPGFPTYTIYDSAYFVTQLECTNGFPCPANRPVSMNNIAPWTMEVSGKDPSSGTTAKLFTMSSRDNVTIKVELSRALNDTNLRDLFEPNYCFTSVNLYRDNDPAHPIFNKTCSDVRCPKNPPACKIKIQYHCPTCPP